MFLHPPTRRLDEHRSADHVARGTTRRWRTAPTILAIILSAALAGCTGDPAPGSATPSSSNAAALADDRPARSDARAGGGPGRPTGVLGGGGDRRPGRLGRCPRPGRLGASTPLTTATRFDIASVSKQFTATAILLLSFDGALTLTDPLSKYVPGLPAMGGSGQHRPADPPHQRHPRLRGTAVTTPGIFFTTPTTQQDALEAIAGRHRTATPQPGTEVFELLELELRAAGRGRPPPRPAVRCPTCSRSGCSARSGWTW